MTCQWALGFIPFVAIHARSLRLSVGSPSQTASACPQAAICQWRLAHLRQWPLALAHLRGIRSSGWVAWPARLKAPVEPDSERPCQ
jgi:hypothetical protein